jgi:hypothetical protein
MPAGTWGFGAEPQRGLGRQLQDFGPVGRILFFMGGGRTLFCWKPKPAAQNYVESKNEKVPPSQTRHKNAMEASQFGRESWRAKLTGTPTARGLFVTFLPSRPLKWGFRMFFRSNFPTFRPQSPRTPNSEYPFIDFGLASSPKSQLLKIAKTQKP